ncbi:unnamed protein product [Moneuplotes crassus]|uniref:Uncharacterized protein n=1 Tax=Euplotes crassus TaxID=5936 RepID=A0AAD1XX88_EUPCR|nr:unnamed protein product [Moneuplotes crassus]
MGRFFNFLFTTSLGAAGYLYYAGAFKSMNIHTTSLGYREAFYRPFQGSFEKDIYPAFNEVMKDIKQLEEKQKSDKIENVNSFGIYYDNPDDLKDRAKCRADIGFTFNNKGLDDTAREELKKSYEEKGYQYTTFKTTDALHENFAIKYPMWVSFWIASYKWYPAAKKRLFENGTLAKLSKGVEYGFIEVYENGNIEFYGPLEHFEDFHLTKFPTPERK